MANWNKNKDKPTPPSPRPPEQKKQKTINGFRLEKLGPHLFQAFKIILRDDGTYIEEPFDRVTLAELLCKRINQFMAKEAYQAFEANKPKPPPVKTPTKDA